MSANSPYRAMTPISILLIDDDASVTGLLTHTLKRDGHKVTSVGSLAQAHGHLESHAPEIILLDHQLTVACGKGSVRLLEVQRAGKRPMSAEEFLRGVKQRAGAVLG